MTKLISVGWDAPTTAQLRRDLPALARAPLNGVALWAQAKGSDLPEGLNTTPFRTGFSRIPWKRSWFTHAIDDLKSVKNRKTPLTDNFLRLDANPGDVDWFDDAGWTAIAEHFGIAAWIAKQGGLPGIIFDAEPYTKPFYPFDYKSQPEAAKHTFDEYLVKARQRGRETMRTMRAEFPDAHVLTFFMTAYFVQSNIYHGPSIPRPGIDPKRALFLHSYGLYLAFLTGWLDEAPPEMTFTDGNEHAYGYTRPEEFFTIAKRIKSEGAMLFPAEVRAKYRRQVKVGSGIYLDAHIKGLLPEYELPEAGTEMLRKNVAAALSAGDGYVWLYGEQGRFWPDPKELNEWPKKAVDVPWEKKLPGVTRALARAQAERVQAVFSPPPPPASPLPATPSGAVNLLKNGDFAQGPPPGKEALPGASSDWGDAGAPAGWNYWQDEFSKGRFDWDAQKKAARAVGVRNGCFLQTVVVRPGERYLIQGYVRAQGTGLGTLSVGFKTDGGAKWLPGPTRRVAIQPVRTDGSGEDFALAVTVPAEAGILVVQLNVSGQPSERDTLRWKRAEVFRLGV
jgi:hypothetical protein